MSQSKSSLDYVFDLLRTPVPLPFGSTSPRTRRARARRRATTGPARVAYSQSFVLTGTIERGAESKYAIGGEDIVIDKDTWIFGEVRYGASASVKGERRGDQNFAKKIVMS